MSEEHVQTLVLAGQPLCTDRFLSEYTRISSIDCLNYDQRLSFVLDFEKLAATSRRVGLLAFCNSALVKSGRLYDVVLGAFAETSKLRHEEDAFATWVINHAKPNGQGPPKVFSGILWTVVSLPDNWALISGIELSHCDLNDANELAHSNNGSLQQERISQESPAVSSSRPSTCLNTQPSLSGPPESLVTAVREVWPPVALGNSAHLAWLRQFDWESTPLGPTVTWSQEMKQTCEMMLMNPDPATTFWGPELVLIYNEAYVALNGNKHPAMMGGSARVHWKEVWDQYDPLFDQMLIDGKAFTQENSQLFINRNGFLEEGFFNMRVMPMLRDDGSVFGFYEPVSEVTRQNLLERRMHMLQNLSERISAETSLDGLWSRLLEAFSDHPSDIHFAILYSRQRQSQATPEPNPSGCYLLEGAMGSGIGPQGFLQTIDVYEPTDGDRFGPIRRAHETGIPVVLTTSDGSFSPIMIQRLKEAGITEAPKTCIACPLSSSVDDGGEALLILGANPKRPYDEDYELFINLLVQQIESKITFVQLLEKDKERLRQQALYDSELKFKKFAENAQVGIFSIDPSGNITFCNDSWLELSGHDRNDMSAMSWTHDVHPDNVAEIKSYWDKIVNGEGPQTFEVQYKKPWRPANFSDDSISLDRTWVVASADAELSDEGELTAVLGCITDISSFKWVDQLQSQRLTEVLELKRQQENFLDITSHEMRNPLNAILHCAAELIQLLPGLAQAGSAAERSKLLRNCLDASRTVVYCGRHQKRIIDDVLTLSKLDSNLLSISPVEIRPLDVVEEVLRVFDTEIRASSIKTKTELAESYKALQIETLLVDPHRLLQILINLVANAVKFTKGESLRGLHVVIDAHETEPISSDSGVRYVPSGRQPADPTVHPDWGTGEIVFLHFSVQDTGPGMSREEADLLFNRFSQASPRTHVQYGGSGLGLFISRELAELHGGRIGISSEPGNGSTFDFYVKGRRSTNTEAPKRLENTSGNIHLPLRLAARPQMSPETLAVMTFPPNVPQHPLDTPTWPSDVHVLIVEDNLINQKILAKIIRKQGWYASVANHGEEALAEINVSQWHKGSSKDSAALLKLDVVLADIEMPVMNGKEFVRHVRRLQGEGTFADGIPVIAVTGNARNEQIQQAKECGFDEVISKPYREEDIVLTVLKYTNRASILELGTVTALENQHY